MITDTSKKVTTIHPPLARAWRTGFVKRGLDILASALGLLVLAPFFGVIAILIKREEPGPVFYRGLRTGRDGREFGILKFRTMREDPKSYTGPRITARDDKRITPLGAWLRDAKLNELPQLWNVLVGEMSLVGPRPEDPEIVKTWPEDARKEILSMRPGITSPASVLYRNEENMLTTDGVMDTYLRDIAPDKLRLDRLYVRHHSFMGDLDVLFWTVVAIVPLISRTRIPEGRLFVGPFYQFARRHFSWFFLDLIASLIVVGIIGTAWRLFETIDWGVKPLAIFAFGVAFLFSIVNVFFGLDRVYWSRANVEDGFLLALSNGFSSLVLFAFNSILIHRPRLFFLPALPPEMIVLFCFFISLASLIIRYRLRLVTSLAGRWTAWRRENTGFGERVLILGAGEGGEIAHILMRHSAIGKAFNVIGIVDDDPSKRGMRVNRAWVLGSSNELPALIEKHDVSIVIFAITNIPPEARERMINLCKRAGARLIHLSDILGAVKTQLEGPSKS
ncbi:MAG: sugar transferase [Chloroflexi bacterium]|nr:sugar transferase [Chloroflexota bacterium]